MAKLKNVLKILLGLVLIAAAGFLAFYVKDIMDSKEPLYNIAQISVYADSQQVETMVGSYSWQFTFEEKAEHTLASLNDTDFPETRLIGGEQIDVTFSVEPIRYEVRRSDAYSYQFMNEDEERLIVPYEPGGYLYEVSAEFPQGIVVYYFYIVIN